MIGISSTRHSPIVFLIGSLLVLLSVAPSGAWGQADTPQADSLERARTIYQKAQTAYEAERDEAVLEHLNRVEELLVGLSGSSVDTLRARRLALLSKTEYRKGWPGEAKRALIKMRKTGAVPPALAAEMDSHSRRVESALMEALPQAVRASIRTAATMDTLNLSGSFSEPVLPDSVNGLPDSIGRLTDLRRLNLSHNELESLPSSLGQLTQLRSLNVSHNRLSGLPDSMRRLTRLQELDLSHNALAEVPAIIVQLSTLRRLDLMGTPLDSLPASIGQLSQLKRLTVPKSLTRTESQRARLQALIPDSANLVSPMRNDYRWFQTARHRVPINERDAPSVLLDSLTNELSRRDSLTVRRSPGHTNEQSFSALRKRLIDTVGTGPSSANYVQIDYQFGIADRKFEERIEGIQFLFRSSPEQEFIPLMYVDGQAPWFQHVLHNEGNPLVTSTSPRPFEKLMQFARHVQRGTILQIDGEDARTLSEREKRAFVRRIQRLTYESM